MFTITDDGPVRTLTIDNPGRRNAVPREGWTTLAGHLADFAASEARVLVITGAGGDFCSGADLAGDIGGLASAATRYRWMQPLAEATMALIELDKPTVAAVDGVAVGAGMNLALACDVVLAGETARFSEIFVQRGLTLDFGGTWLLPRLIGMARAKELALTGRIIGAEEALAYGLVARVVPSADLAAAAAGLAAELASGAPIAQRFIKMGFNRSLGMSLAEAIEYESQAQSVCLGTEDFVEGVTAFLEKRPPEFGGR
ncbi:MAG: enoyl-CoA hydratase/isomerase family protein [Actinobacteria bacterium]|nr:enoyl-CoA hydratase/isomerase family protein [Actinomycetota bacterium]